MRKQCYFLLLFVLINNFYTGVAQSIAPAILWQQTIGGSNTEVLTGMCMGANKSVVLCGYSNSGISGNKSTSSFGGNDYWVVKLDSSGNVLWNKTYGGNDEDYASAIIATADGGYLVGGSSVSNKSGNKTNNSYGNSFDYWVLKLDADGNKVWDVTRGGAYTEKLTSLAELPGIGYLLGGNSYSGRSGSKNSANMSSETNADYWLVTLNTNGTERKQDLFGGQGHDVLTFVAPFGTGGYYAAGYSYSKQGGSKTKAGFGNNDYYIVRSNLKGQMEYDGDFGGKLSDYLTCMQVLPDSSLILGGYSNSSRFASKSENFMGVTDFWLLKLKRDGTRQWDKTISGLAGGDYLMSVQQTKDMGFILGGYSNSNAGNNKTENSKGSYDYWIVKTDSLGKVQWDKTIGGSGSDKLTVVYEIDTNQYIVAGTSASAISGDKSSGIIGGSTASDYWIVRLGTPPAGKLFKTAAIDNTDVYGKYSLAIKPNPVKNVLTLQYKAEVNAKANLVVYAANGKPVLQAAFIAGSTTSVRSFNIAYLPAGSYIAVLYVGTTKLTKTFTKE